MRRVVALVAAFVMAPSLPVFRVKSALRAIVNFGQPIRSAPLRDLTWAAEFQDAIAM
jgi:hypothetical protein